MIEPRRLRRRSRFITTLTLSALSIAVWAQPAGAAGEDGVLDGTGAAAGSAPPATVRWVSQVDAVDERLRTGELAEWIGPDRTLDECFSAIPKPGCGGKDRGGWRQTAVFGVMLGGLALIGGRVVYAARRRTEQT